MFNQNEIMINRFAQEKINLEQVLEWFDALDSENQFKAVASSIMCLEQSDPDQETIENVIKLIPLKETVTPIVLLKTKTLNLALRKIALLPINEYRKVFIVIIFVFKEADTKRRKFSCKDGCTHYWHNLEQ